MIENYVNKFNEKIKKSAKRNFIGYNECREYDMLTAKQLFSKTKQNGRNAYICRIRHENYLQKVRRWYKFFENIDLSDIKENEISIFGRFVGTNLYEFPFLFSGYESRESLNRRSYDKRYKPTDEHFYPRQLAGEIIVVHILLNEYINYDDLLNYVNVFRQVHRVTPEENTRLVHSGQKTNEFISPELCYKNAGIELVKVIDDDVNLIDLKEVTPRNVLDKVFGDRLNQDNK